LLSGFCFWVGTLHETLKELEGASGIGSSWGVFMGLLFYATMEIGLPHWIMTSSKAADGIQDAMYITTTTLRREEIRKLFKPYHR